MRREWRSPIRRIASVILIFRHLAGNGLPPENLPCIPSAEFIGAFRRKMDSIRSRSQSFHGNPSGSRQLCDRRLHLPVDFIDKRLSAALFDTRAVVGTNFACDERDVLYAKVGAKLRNHVRQPPCIRLGVSPFPRVSLALMPKNAAQTPACRKRGTRPLDRIRIEVAARFPARKRRAADSARNKTDLDVRFRIGHRTAKGQPRTGADIRTVKVDRLYTFSPLAVPRELEDTLGRNPVCCVRHATSSHVRLSYQQINIRWRFSRQGGGKKHRYGKHNSKFFDFHVNISLTGSIVQLRVILPKHP